jgi:hypothetical protein
MGRFMANCTNDHSQCLFINVIENTVLADAQFPDWLNLSPGRRQPHQNLPVAALPTGLTLQLYFNAV